MKLFKRNDNYFVDNPKLSLADEMFVSEGGTLEVELRLIDTRVMSNKQRGFIFKLCSEVEDNTGLDAEMFRGQSIAQNVLQNEVMKSSLTEYSMTDANKLIDIIIAFFIENSIPLPKKLLEDNEFKLSKQHIYIMTLKRKCCICSKHADIHHVDPVGMGFNRNEISHVGMRILPLCREHHIEAHTIGNQSLIYKYHLTTIEVDKRINHFIKRGSLKAWKEKGEETK